MNQHTIQTRIFLVGCPRSGTTLLQSLLAAHPQIASFPESHFCSAIFIPRSPKRQKFKLASKFAWARLEEFLGKIGKQEMKQYLPKFGLFPSQYAHSFIKILDILTQQQNKSIWLEKTPGHLRYINYLEKWVKDAKFIHIIRNGADVVASLFEVTHQHPDIWNGAWDINKCIQQWILDVKLSQSYSHQPNHTLVKYEILVENPQLVLTEICEFIGVKFTENMLLDYQAIAKQVSLTNETWKASATQGIKNANSQKFYQVFDEAQRQYILEKISSIS